MSKFNLMAKPKVFITQEQPRFNYSDAERFGDLVFVAVNDYSPNAGSLINDRVIIAIKHAASIFNPMKDYLLLTGGPITMGLSFFHFATVARTCVADGVDGIRCLQWDRDRESYRQVIVRIS